MIRPGTIFAFELHAGPGGVPGGASTSGKSPSVKIGAQMSDGVGQGGGVNGVVAAERLGDVGRGRRAILIHEMCRTAFPGGSYRPWYDHDGDGVLWPTNAARVVGNNLSRFFGDLRSRGNRLDLLILDEEEAPWPHANPQGVFDKVEADARFYGGGTYATLAPGTYAEQLQTLYAAKGGSGRGWVQGQLGATLKNAQWGQPIHTAWYTLFTPIWHAFVRDVAVATFRRYFPRGAVQYDLARFTADAATAPHDYWGRPNGDYSGGQGLAWLDYSGTEIYAHVDTVDLNVADAGFAASKFRCCAWVANYAIGSKIFRGANPGPSSPPPLWWVERKDYNVGNATGPYWAEAARHLLLLSPPGAMGLLWFNPGYTSPSHPQLAELEAVAEEVRVKTRNGRGTPATGGLVPTGRVGGGTQAFFVTTRDLPGGETLSRVTWDRGDDGTAAAGAATVTVGGVTRTVDPPTAAGDVGRWLN